MCGREMVAGNFTANASGEAKSVQDFPNIEAPRIKSQEPVSVNSSFVGVGVSAQAALNSARAFSAINRVIFVLGLAGSILLIIFAFVPTCPPLEPSCWSSDKELYNFGSFITMGLGSLLSVLWLNGIAETIATRAALAAEVANEQTK